jgi:hypothetical protein
MKGGKSTEIILSRMLIFGHQYAEQNGTITSACESGDTVAEPTYQGTAVTDQNYIRERITDRLN